MEGLLFTKQMDLFFDKFSMNKNAPRCGETLIFIIFVGRQRFRRVHDYIRQSLLKMALIACGAGAGGLRDCKGDEARIYMGLSAVLSKKCCPEKADTFIPNDAMSWSQICLRWKWSGHNLP